MSVVDSLTRRSVASHRVFSSPLDLDGYLSARVILEEVFCTLENGLSLDGFLGGPI